MKAPAPRNAPRWPQWLCFVTFGVACSVPLGCGRPATQADCDFIVGRIAELELRADKESDPATIEKQVANTKSEFQSKAKSECVGKRVTERALRCVKNAKTAEEIVHECLN